MAYNALNNLIDAYIYANGVQAITGQILNGVLKQMVSQLGSGYHLMGVAGPETTPEQNDYAMAYFAATAGEYTDFGGITLTAGEVAVLLTSGNGSWSKQTVYNVPTGTDDLENTANFITNAVTDLVNYYTKTEVDATLEDYPTLQGLATALADYYTKTEIDGQMGDVDTALADRYTKSETDTKLSDYYKKTETYDKDEVDSIVAALSRQEYIVAWDGLAAPDVSAIPAGVTVTYSGTTYTGTLAASASTVNKIYMVWNGTAYDMYGTSQDGGYSWVPMGTTTVDLSQYATKAELSQLQQEVGEKVSTEELSEMIDLEENPEYVKVLLDNDGKILATIDKDLFWEVIGILKAKCFIADNGDFGNLSTDFFNVADVQIDDTETSEFPYVVLDGEERILLGVTKQGFGLLQALKIKDNAICEMDKSEFSYVILDGEERLLFGITAGGKVYTGADNGTQSAEMYVEKTSNRMDVYIKHDANKFIHYKMVLRQKEYVEGVESFYDNWGVERVGLSSFDGAAFTHIKYLYREGETEQAIEAQSANGLVFVGGYFHGFEQMNTADGQRKIYFIIDGNFLGETDTYPLSPCNYVKVVQETSLYQFDTTTNPFDTVLKEWVFENGKLRLTTDNDFLRNITVRTIAGSMICVYRHDEGNSSNDYLTDKGIKDNNPTVVIDLQDGHNGIPNDHDCTELSEYGELGFSFAMKVVDGSKMHQTGGLAVVQSVSTYNKIYGYTLLSGGAGIEIPQGANYGLVSEHIIK